MARCAICGHMLAVGQVVHAECLPRWIPVADSLPDEGETVFVIVNGHNDNISFVDALEFASWTATDGWVLENYPEYEDPEVRCWMSTTVLPAPPKGDAKDVRA